MSTDLQNVDAARPGGPHGNTADGAAPEQPKSGIVSSPLGCLSRSATLRWAACAAYVALVTWLSLAPARVFEWVSPLFPLADKFVHFLMYGFLVMLLRWAMAGHGMRWRPQGFWMPLAAFLYGGLMELGQLLLVPADRSFEVGDMIANGLGALVFWGAYSLWDLRRLGTVKQTPPL